MNVRVGDTVEVIHHMSNRGKVIKVHFRSVKAGIGSGPLSKAMWITFESEMDNKVYEMKAQDLRKVRE